MKRIHTRLGTKAEENTAACNIEPSGILRENLFADRKQRIQLQCSRRMVQHQKAHECNHTADYGYCKINSTCIHRLLLLIMDHADIGSQRHDFKENKCCKQII